MRMRYERRDPRPEDLREITELRNRLDQQDRDIRKLTEGLREYQLQPPTPPRKIKPKKQQQNCDVIYEESELESSDFLTNGHSTFVVPPSPPKRKTSV